MNFLEALALGMAGGAVKGAGDEWAKKQQAKKLEGFDLSKASISDIMSKTGMNYQQAVEASWAAQDRAKKSAPIKVGEMFNKYGVKKKETYTEENPEFATIPSDMISPQGVPISETVPKTIEQTREVPYAPGEEELTPEQWEIEKPFIQNRIEESTPIGKAKIKEAQIGLGIKETNLEMLKDELTKIQKLREKYSYDKEIQDFLDEKDRKIKEQTEADVYNKAIRDLTLSGIKSGIVDVSGKPIKPTKPESKKLSESSKQKIKNIENKITQIQKNPEQYGYYTEGELDITKLNRSVESLQKQIEDIISQDSGEPTPTQLGGKKVISQATANGLLNQGYTQQEIDEAFNVR